MGGPCGGFGTDIGLILWGQGRGMGGWGTDIGDVYMGGLGTEMGMLILWGWGCFRTDIGDVNIIRGRGALGRDWGCSYCEEVGVRGR